MGDGHVQAEKLVQTSFGASAGALRMSCRGALCQL